jgi:hypothetical protein
MKEYMCKGAVDGRKCSRNATNIECMFMIKPHICDRYTCSIRRRYGEGFCWFGSIKHASYCQCVSLPLDIIMKRIIKEHEENEK